MKLQVGDIVLCDSDSVWRDDWEVARALGVVHVIHRGSDNVGVRWLYHKDCCAATVKHYHNVYRGHVTLYCNVIT